MWVKTALIGVTFYFQVSHEASSECRDLNGRRISQGFHYIPGPDTCTLCVCDNGNPKWCHAVLCSPSQDCKTFRVGSSCCEFICLDDTLSKSPDGGLNLDGNTDLGLRLIASAVTAILSLSLLFFLIHRLRQRKVRGRQTRQLSEDERSLGSIGYIAGSIGYLQGSMGYLGNGSNDLEFHYEEPPSHYPLWKPPGNYFPRGEAPPPYEEAVAAARAEAAMIATVVSAHSNPTLQHSVVQTVPTGTSHNVTSQTDISANQRSELSTINVSSRDTRSDMSTTLTRNDTGHSRTERLNARSDLLETNYTQNCQPNSNIQSVNHNQSVRNDTQNHPRNDRHSQSCNTAISLISHNGHRTIPKILTNSNSKFDSSLCSTSNTSLVRREAQTETPIVNTESNENKSNQRRTTLPKEKVLGTNNEVINSYFENVIPSLSSLVLGQKENCSTVELTSNRHRTIPRHLTHIEPHVPRNSSFGQANYNVSSSTGNILNLCNSPLPTSPVPPPIVFSGTLGNSVNNEFLKDTNTITKVNNSNSVTNLKPNSSIVTSRLQKVAEDVVLNTSMSPSRDCDSSFDGSSQCLHQTFDDGDDYRSECENCKSAHGSRYYLAEDDEDELSSPNETMTLQRRPIEPPTDTLTHGSSFYRTSLTLPTNTRKHRSTSMHGTPSNHGAREAWFSSMPESTSSESDED